MTKNQATINVSLGYVLQICSWIQYTYPLITKLGKDPNKRDMNNFYALLLCIYLDLDA